MITLPAPSDTIIESQRLIAALEQRFAELPFAEDVLAIHRSTHRELEQSYSVSEDAVAAWRAALARRWEAEVAGRRLCKQVMRQLADYYGNDAPQLQLLSRGGAEADSSPAEMLEDLRRLDAALKLNHADLPFAQQRLQHIAAAAAILDRAIIEAAACEHRRRIAVLDSRMAREVYRRVRSETKQTILKYYGDSAPLEFSSIFEQ